MTEKLLHYLPLGIGIRADCHIGHLCYPAVISHHSTRDKFFILPYLVWILPDNSLADHQADYPSTVCSHLVSPSLGRQKRSRTNAYNVPGQVRISDSYIQGQPTPKAMSDYYRTT